ncbi:hypothetical protein JIQ42_07536 [Leishmania sp. Namibia]|uniref:hypothetical protein n=1 Tax=Leishmania sp. Namibia TaxID=2802991 RepID=UPI001B588758|nr:hypothetical protein JIQ42_07536 [Leishmania sp. Namibia]
MNRGALFVSDGDSSDYDHVDIFSLEAASAGDRAVSGASGSRLAEDPLSAGAASQLYSSSVRSSTSAVQLPGSSIVTATRRNLSQLFGAGPALLKAPATASSQLTPSATRTTATGTAANGTAAGAGSAAKEATTFFAPRFDYDGSSGTGIASGTAAAFAVARGEAAAGLITAEHAVVQAYRDSLCSGTCMLALCVPPAASAETASAASPPPSAAVRRHLSHERQEAGSASNAAVGSPTLMLTSINRQVLCRVALGATDAVFASESLQLRQDAAQPQYLTFFDDGRAGIRGSNSRSAGGGGSSGCWWTCMFPDRDKASRFLVSAYTIAQYAAALAKRTGTTSVPVPSVRTLPSPPPSKTEKAAVGPAGGAPRVVRPDMPATMCWQAWELRRVSKQTLYCVPGRCIEVVPPSTPQTVAATDGTLWDAVAAALVGMQEGESRLVFLTPEDTRVRQPRSQADPRRSNRSDSNALQRALDTPVVVYMTCLQVASSPISAPAPSTPAAAGDLALPLPPPPPPAPATAAAAVTAPPPAAAPSQPPHAVDALSTNALLQQFLLHLLQQQPPQQSSASASHQGPSQEAWESVERTLAGVRAQLGSLHEKIDRLDIEAKLQHNNTELERAMRRVVGLAPQEAVAVEDSLKDREALLASIELYRHKFEEANANYQRALEAVGRSSDRAQALERDLHVQQDLWARQRKDEAEQTRLRLVERDARHRDELERVSEKRYAEGKSDGHAAGYREGRQATLLEVEGSSTGGSGGSVVAEWRAKLMAKEQEVTALQMALQDAKFRHERDRRQLRAEIDVLSELNEKLQHLQANADVRVPEETVQQQCKRVKRTLNAVYSQVEGKLLLLSSLPLHSRSKNPRSSPTVDEGGSGEKTCEALGAGGTDITAAVAVDDVLAIITEAIRSEAQAAVAQIRCDEAQRTAKNAKLRELTVARCGEQQQTPASHYGHPPSTSSVFLADYEAQEEVRGPEIEHSSAAKRAPATPPPPPLPPVHTAASRDELAAVAAALLPEVAQAASVKASASESAVGAAEDAFRGGGRACEGTAVTRVTGLPAAAEEPSYSEAGAKVSSDKNGGADSASHPLYSAPALADFDATATSSMLCPSAGEKSATGVPDVGDNSPRTASSCPATARIAESEVLAGAGDREALLSNVGDSTGDASHAFPSSAIVAADAAAAARASASRSSSPGVVEEEQLVPTPSAAVATSATSASSPARMGADNQFMTHRTHAELDVVHAVDISSAHTSRRSTSSLSSSSSTPAKPSRMATRLPADAPASPPPPALSNTASLVHAAAGRAAPSSDAQFFSSPSAALRDWQGSLLFSSPPSTGGE